ncbi:MAG: single-stranded DNA-binding protein [Candidatus Omnitrophota bacterium]
MANLNKVFIIGNLTKDPELRYTPSGMAVVNLRVATNRRFRDKNGEQKDEACFITVVVWDKQAEACNQYLRKGSPVFIEGRLQSRSWEAQDGSKRNVIEIRAERVQFLSNLRQQDKTENGISPAPYGAGSEDIREPEENLAENSSAGTLPESEG